MILYYLKTAYKNILKNLRTSFINILGLGLGLACVIFIYLWVNDELSFEQHHQKLDQIHQVYLSCDGGNDIYYQATTPPVISSRISEMFPEIKEAARVFQINEVALKHEENVFIENSGIAADPSVFKIFDYEILSGDPETALSNPNSMVLTKSLAEKYFGDADPLGKTILADNKYSFTIKAVINDLPSGTYRSFDYIVPIEFLNFVGVNTEGGDFFPCSYINYFLLNKNADCFNLCRISEFKSSQQKPGRGFEV